MCNGFDIEIIQDVIGNFIICHSQMATVGEDLAESMMFVLMYHWQLLQRMKSMRSVLRWVKM